MECGWFCVLCGAPLDITGEAHNLDPDDERYRVSTVRVRVPILGVLTRVVDVPVQAFRKY
jgi:hypothetical protein